MIIHINSYPGVGKLTIGRILADRLGAKLLDNHTIYNVAFALTEYKSDGFYEAGRAVRQIAYQHALALPKEVPLILTNAHAQASAWGNECWDAVIELAKAREVPLLIVVLACSPEENQRRIQGADRAAKRKPQDPHMFKGNADGVLLLDRGGDHTLKIDITNLSAADAANAIGDWIESCVSSFRGSAGIK
jgi:predicted kinase